jgi:peptidoglycan/LPS O-acetylase OafA/YrhL
VPTLFPIWWSGVELAHQFIANRRLSWKDSWFAILSLTVLACLKPLFLIHPLSGRDSQLVDIRLVENLFVFGLGIISVALIAQNWIFLSRKWNRNSVRTLGSSSYALYLIHFPILMFVSVHGGGVLGLLAVLPVSLTIAICLETVFHRKISGFLKRKLVLA